MRVVLATDGSKHAREAALWLTTFPLPAESAVEVLGVAPVRHPPIGVPPAVLDELAHGGRDHARRAVDEARALLEARWRQVEVRVEEVGPPGDPRDAIVRATEAADLVVLGSRGLGAIGGFLLGSVSTAVARHAHCAVLVTKSPPRPVRTVLVGVDGSEDAVNAVRFLAALGGLRDAKVHVLGVVEDLKRRSFASVSLTRLKGLIAEAQSAIERDLRRVATEAAVPLEGTAGEVAVEIVAGHPAREIVRVAQARSCDLIVVGARGLGVMQRLALGSVSENVLQHARCPVLIVHRR